MLKIHVRHGILVDEKFEVISFRQSKWLEKNINFSKQKGNRYENGSEKDFYRSLKNSIYGKSIENVRNRQKEEFIEKDDNERILKDHQN